MKSLGARLAGSFALLVVFIGGIAWTLAVNLGQDFSEQQHADAVATRMEEDADRLRGLSANMQRLALEAAITGSDEKLLLAGAEASEYFALSDRIRSVLQAETTLPLRAERIEQLVVLNLRFRSTMANTLSILAEHLEVGSDFEVGALDPDYQAFRLELEAFSKLAREAKIILAARAGDRLRNRLVASAGLLFALLLAIAAVFWFIRRSIVLRTAELARFLAAAEASPLHVVARIDSVGRDEIAVIAHAVNRLFDQLQQTAVSKEFFDRVVENIGNALFVTDHCGRVTLVNAAALGTLDRPREEIIGLALGELLSCAKHLDEDIPAGTECHLNGRQPIPVGCMRTTIPDGYVYVAVDLRERNAALAELRLAAKVIDNVSQGLVISLPNGKIVDVNPAFCALTGYRPEEVIGHPVELLSTGLTECHDRSAHKQIAGFTHEGELMIGRKSGQNFPAWISYSAVLDENGIPSHFVTLLSDITERKEQQHRIEHIAFHDGLTDLPNRTLLKERMNQAVIRARRQGNAFVVMFLDLDHFKHINDSLGHAAGDALLKIIAKRLTSCVRATDTVCRQGGDEFIIVAACFKEVRNAGKLAAKILTRLAEPIVLDQQTVNTSFSIGIATYPEDGDDPEQLLKNADSAMYQAKQAGRNTYRFFAPDMDEAATQRLWIETGLRQTLEEGGFQLHYQPQFELASGRLLGVEALLRWPHSERGMIAPDQFIPVAEECGLIVPIGEWVLNEALRQMAAWRAAGLDVGRCAVNVSVVQFQRDHLTAKVPGLLASHGLASDVLELEITESMLVTDNLRVSESLHALKSQGVALAIDDFGTGYSSLAYLRRYAVDTIKIDRSFIAGLGVDSDSLAIIRAIIEMAHGLHLKVVAEGIETETQLEQLRVLGCDQAQGFLLARPMPAAEVEQLLAAHRA